MCSTESYLRTTLYTIHCGNTACRCRCGSATPTELCEYAQQGATNMTRIANVLVKAGLVTRATSAEDRRRIVLTITTAGKRLVRKILPPLFPNVHGAFASLSATDKRTLDRLLRQVAVNIDSLTQQDARP